MSNRVIKIMSNSAVCIAALVFCVIAAELIYRATIEKKH